MKKYLFLVINLILVHLISQAQTEKGSFLIKNATVLTITDGIHENTDVLVEKGLIQKIGEGNCPAVRYGRD